MRRRTLPFLIVGLPVSLAAVTVYLTQSVRTNSVSKAAISASPKASDITQAAPAADVPTVTVNGTNVPVAPGSTTHFSDRNSQTTVTSSGTAPTNQSVTTTTTDTSEPGTTVEITQSTNGNSNSSQVETQGNSSISVSTRSSVRTSGGSISITPAD